MNTTPEQNERRELLRQDLEYLGVPMRESRLDSSALFSALDALWGAVDGLHDLAEESYNKHDSRLIKVREAVTRAQDIIADSFQENTPNSDA